jgi:uncharacterized lipoprotein YmbA
MRFATLTLVALTMVGSGCGVLDPKPDSSRYFLLRPLAEAGSGPALDDLVLGVGPMNVPDYLDRTEMIELVGPYEVRYSAQDRWVEPLGTQLRRVLAENLMTLLRPGRVVEYPWYEAERVGLQVEVTFEPIRLDANGAWTGDAFWLVRDGSSHEEVARGAFAMELGSTPVDGNGVAARLSEEVRRMSGEIAVAVRGQHGMRR